MAIDGNYAQHLANGGCPSLHGNGSGGQIFCQDRDGHYSWFTSRHWAKMIRFSAGGGPSESIHVEWN